MVVIPGTSPKINSPKAGRQDLGRISTSFGARAEFPLLMVLSPLYLGGAFHVIFWQLQCPIKPLAAGLLVGGRFSSFLLYGEL